MLKLFNDFTKPINNKKGFTIVELVIVIAVIAILSAVLIPTFNNIIESANMSKATQEVKNSIKNFYNDNIDYDLEKLVIVYYDKDSNKGEIKYIFTNEKQELKPLEYDSYSINEKVLAVNGIIYYELMLDKSEGIPDHIVLYTIDDITEYYNLIVDEKSKLISHEEKSRIEKEYRKGEIVTINLQEHHNIKYLLYINEKLANFNVVSYYENLNSNDLLKSIKEISIKVEKDIVIRIDYIDLHMITIDNDSKYFFDNSSIEELQTYHEHDENITITPILSKQYELELYIDDAFVSTLKLGENETYSFNITKDIMIRIVSVEYIEPPKDESLLLKQIVSELNDLDIYKVNEIIQKDPIILEDAMYKPNYSMLKNCIYLDYKAHVVEFLTSLGNLQYKLYEEPINAEYSDYSYVFLLDDEVIEITIEKKYVIDGNIYLLDTDVNEYVNLANYSFKYGFIVDTDNNEARVYIKEDNEGQENDIYVDINALQESVDLRRIVLSYDVMDAASGVDISRAGTIKYDKLKTKYLKIENNYFEIIDRKTINILDTYCTIISDYSLEAFINEFIVDVYCSNAIDNEIQNLFKVRVDDYITLGFVKDAIQKYTEYKEVNFDYSVTNGIISSGRIYNDLTFDEKIMIDSQGWTIMCEYNKEYHYSLTIKDGYHIVDDVSNLSGIYHSGSIVNININDLELPDEKVLLITETSDERFIQRKYKAGTDISYEVEIVGSDVTLELLIVGDENVFEEELYLKDVNKDVYEITRLDSEYVKEIIYIESSKLSSGNTLTECNYVLNNTDREKEYVFHFISCLDQMKYSSMKNLTNAIQSGSTGYYIVNMNDGTSYSFMLSGTINSLEDSDSSIELYLNLPDMTFISVKNCNVSKEGLTLFNSSMLYKDNSVELKPNHKAILYDMDIETKKYIDIRGIIFKEYSFDSNIIDETKNFSMRINKDSNIESVNNDDKVIIYFCSSNIIRVESNNQKYHYQVINDFSFEKYLPCIIMTNVIEIYNLEEELLCAIRVSLGQIVSKDDLIKHIGDIYSEDMIFVDKEYKAMPGQGPKDIFSEMNQIIITNNMEIILLPAMAN